MTDSIVSLALLFVASALTSYVATGIVRHGAMRIGLVDQPGERKIHPVATPRLGGLAIIFGFGFPLLVMGGDAQAANLAAENLTYLFGVLAAAALMIGLGVYDDLIGTNAPQKFIVQFAAAIILVSFGFHFSFVSVAGEIVEFGFLGSLASVLWIVGVINAVNFIDGMDSLATVFSITVAIAFGAIAVIRADTFSLIIMTALAGSLAGFFPWNKPPAKIFMGDSGSLFIGLLLAAVSIVKPSKSPTAFLIGGPMLALALPVIDTLIVMKQRFGGREVPMSIGERVTRMFNADRRHIHHILIAKFGSTAKAVLSIWIVTVLFAAAAVLTVIQATKVFGYTFGILGFLVLLVLRYWPRRRATEPQPASDDTVRA